MNEIKENIIYVVYYFFNSEVIYLFIVIIFLLYVNILWNIYWDEIYY